MSDPSQAESDQSRRIADLRITYDYGTLLESDLLATPLDQFRAWLDEAVKVGIVDPNGMVLSTVGPQGQPSSRSVLLKDADDRGFAFFSYLGSRKGQELTANTGAALLFPWYAMHRQVVVVGHAERLPDGEAAEYFRSRPHDSQVGAWTSRQSQVVSGRDEIEERFAAARARFPEGSDVPVPDVWAGWLVRPTSIEFWQGRPSRLHDRLRFRLVGDAVPHLATPSGWVVERLSP